MPRHRGGSAINWAIIEGDRETGVSVFWVDAGIDTGPLLAQRPIAIGADDSAGSLYYGRVVPAGVELVLDSVDAIAQGTAPRVVQDERLATYEPLCRDAHARVDWSWPAARVHDLVRGCDPQPGAYAIRGASQLRLYDSRRVAAAGGAAGTILACGADGLVVAAGEGAVRFGKARLEGTREKKPAAEVAAAAGLEAGDRFDA